MLPFEGHGARAAIVAGRGVAIAAVAWDIPGLDRQALLAWAGGRRARAASRGLPPEESQARLRAVCREVLERAGCEQALRDGAVECVVVGDRLAGPQGPRGSFAALAQAVRRIERGEVDRLIVAGLMRVDQSATGPVAARPFVRGVCAVLLEADACLAARPIGRSRLVVVAHAEASLGHCDRTHILGLLQHHADKTLYVDVHSALLPAVGLVASRRALHVVDLAAEVPHDEDCQCLLQLISLFERHAIGAPSDPRGAVFASDGLRGGDPAGVIVIAPAGEPPRARGLAPS